MGASSPSVPASASLLTILEHEGRRPHPAVVLDPAARARHGRTPAGVDDREPADARDDTPRARKHHLRLFSRTPRPFLGPTASERPVQGGPGLHPADPDVRNLVRQGLGPAPARLVGAAAHEGVPRATRRSLQEEEPRRERPRRSRRRRLVARGRWRRRRKPESQVASVRGPARTWLARGRVGAPRGRQQEEGRGGHLAPGGRAMPRHLGVRGLAQDVVL